MRQFRSYQVPLGTFPACMICAQDVQAGEVVTIASGRVLCGDCLNAAMMSRLEVVVDTIEAKVAEREIAHEVHE